MITKFIWFLARVIYKIGLRQPFLYDIAHTERIAEYGWILNNITKHKAAILDVGCFGTYFPAMLSTQGHEVCGIDIKKDKTFFEYSFDYIVADVLSYDFRKKNEWEKYDYITVISSLEHMLENDEDTQVMKKLFSLLKEDGKILVTVSFGKSIKTLGYRAYNLDMLSCFGTIEKIEYFKRDLFGHWRSAPYSFVESVDNSKSVKAIACVVYKNGNFVFRTYARKK